MSTQVASPHVKAISARGPSKRALLRITAVAGIAVALTLLVASSTLAAGSRASGASGVRFFQGDKACLGPYAAPPMIVCTITTSNVVLLQNASVAYTGDSIFFTDPVAPDGSTNGGRIDSDVLLTTTGSRPSTANGHCTFYNFTGTGLCTYSGGTRHLAGFHAVLVVGTNADGTFSLVGKYWFEGS